MSFVGAGGEGAGREDQKAVSESQENARVGTGGGSHYSVYMHPVFLARCRNQCGFGVGRERPCCPVGYMLL